ncbi:hypothetical protein CISIN_1g0415591mg, partial [Citrus sinensis]
LVTDIPATTGASFE